MTVTIQRAVVTYEDEQVDIEALFGFYDLDDFDGEQLAAARAATNIYVSRASSDNVCDISLTYAGHDLTVTASYVLGGDGSLVDTLIWPQGWPKGVEGLLMPFLTILATEAW